MYQPHLEFENYSDEDGNPVGGFVQTVGLDVIWQAGPLGRPPHRAEKNGAFVEDLIEACIIRLEYYQSSRFNCQYNADAIDYLKKARACLQARTADREGRDVEGTNNV